MMTLVRSNVDPLTPTRHKDTGGVNVVSFNQDMRAAIANVDSFFACSRNVRRNLIFVILFQNAISQNLTYLICESHNSKALPQLQCQR